MKRSLKSWAAATAALTVVGGGLAAYAFWTDSAVYSDAYATTDNPTGNLSVTASVDTSGPMWPGGPGQTVTWTATNNSSTTITLSSLAISVATADGAAWFIDGCSYSDFQFVDNNQTIFPAYSWGYSQLLSQELTPGAQLSDTVKIQMVNSSGNQNGCKNVHVPLYVSVG